MSPSAPEAIRASRRPIAILGFGLEGQSTWRWLRSGPTPSRAIVVVEDGDANRMQVDSDTTFVSSSDLPKWGDAVSVLWRSPGFRITSEILSAFRPILLTSQVNEFTRQFWRQTVGVTGTKGKSTTTALVGAILQRCVSDVRLGGNFGEPVFDIMQNATPETLFAIEYSSFQLNDIEAAPRTAVLLKAMREHLDWHGSEDAYRAAKLRIVQRMKPGGRAIVHRQWLTRDFEETQGISIQYFDGADLAPALAEGSRLIGLHNWDNIEAAARVGRLYGASEPQIAEAIAEFEPLPGRLEVVRHTSELEFVLDIRSTIPEVTMAAVEALERDRRPVRFLIIGGGDRGQRYEELIAFLKCRHIECLYLFEPTGHRIAACLTNADYELDYLEVQSMQSAMDDIRARLGRREAPTREVCLLSSAAPSTQGVFRGPHDKVAKFIDAVARAWPDAVVPR